MTLRALIVDDDPSLIRVLQRILTADGFSVESAETSEAGRDLAIANAYDAVIVDLGLPDGHGTELIRSLRAAGRTMPIAVFTGTADADATIAALNAGADDYITKPVSLDVFKARVRALVRRGGPRQAEQLSLGNVTFDRLTRQVSVGGKPLHITSRELALLDHFLQRAGTVVTRDELLARVFEIGFDPGTNVVEVSVSRLRRKLSGSGATVRIVSRRSIGFLMEPTSGV